MELGHTIGVSYEVYRATITLHGQPHRLITFPALSSVIAIGGAITLCVQVNRFPILSSPSLLSPVAKLTTLPLSYCSHSSPYEYTASSASPTPTSDSYVFPSHPCALSVASCCLSLL